MSGRGFERRLLPEKLFPWVWTATAAHCHSVTHVTCIITSSVIIEKNRVEKRCDRPIVATKKQNKTK